MDRDRAKHMKRIKKGLLIFGTLGIVAAFGVSSYGMVNNTEEEAETEMWFSEETVWEDYSGEDDTVIYEDKAGERSDALWEDLSTDMYEESTEDESEDEIEPNTQEDEEIEDDTQIEAESEEGAEMERETDSEKENDTEKSEKKDTEQKKSSSAAGSSVTDRRNTETENSKREAETKEPEYKYDTGYIFMGDSRIYLMNEDCEIEDVPNFFAVCCPGIGYEWMIETALPKIKTIQSTHSEIQSWVIISALGINDMENANKYLRAYRSLAKKSNLWLVSVNPTNGRSEPQYNNICIDAFNKRLQSVQGVTYINSHDYLVKKGFDTKDGVHYTPASNWDIYSYYLTSLKAGKDTMPERDMDAKQLALSLVRDLSWENE